MSIRFVHWNLDFANLAEVFLIWTHLDLPTRVSPNQPTWSLRSGSWSKLSNCVALINWTSLIFSALWNADRPKCQKELLVSTCHFLVQLYLLIFSVKVSIDRFFVETYFSFLNSMIFVLYIGTGILIGKQWQKCDQYKLISIFQLKLLENYSFEFSIKVWIELYFKMAHILINLLFCSFCCSLFRLKMQKSPDDILFFDFQTHISPKLPASILATKFFCHL